MPISSDSEHPDVLDSDTECKPSGSDSPQPFSRVELNNQTGDLGLFKEAAELLVCRLKEKLIEPHFIVKGKKNKEFVKYFEEEANLPD